MKKILILLISILGLALMFSCEEDQVGPTLDLSQANAPTITSPANGFVLVLEQPMADSTLKIEWTKADYFMEGIPEIVYSVLLTYTEDGTSVTLANTTSLSIAVTYQSLNYRLFDFGLEPEHEGDFELKVTASISDNATSDNLLSSPVSISLTPFDDEPPPAKPIYLLGSATEAGWNNQNALEMTHIDAGIYEITASLVGGSGQELKFISVLGQWAPQWGTDATGTWESGPLAYRPDETVADPPAIPAPPEDGDYLIVADTANLVYTVTPIAEKLYLFGNATEAGTNLAKAIPMTKVAPMKFLANVYLRAGENLTFGFTVSPRSNSAKWGVSNGKLSYIPSDYSAGDKFIPAPENEGYYQIEVDLINRTYSIIER